MTCIEFFFYIDRVSIELKKIFLLTLTVNSPVTASKPTWMVCSKSDGREISGRSFFLLAE